MKVTITYNLPEESEEFEAAAKAMSYKMAIARIRDEVFRPHRKHGYGNETLDSEEAYKVISILEGKFNDILNEEDANE